MPTELTLEQERVLRALEEGERVSVTDFAKLPVEVRRIYMEVAASHPAVRAHYARVAGEEFPDLARHERGQEGGA